MFLRVFISTCISFWARIHPFPHYFMLYFSWVWSYLFWQVRLWGWDLSDSEQNPTAFRCWEEIKQMTDSDINQVRRVLQTILTRLCSYGCLCVHWVRWFGFIELKKGKSKVVNLSSKLPLCGWNVIIPGDRDVLEVDGLSNLYFISRALFSTTYLFISFLNILLNFH